MAWDDTQTSESSIEYTEWNNMVTYIKDEQVKIDIGATPGYIGATGSDGVLRVDSTITYADGGNHVTLSVANPFEAADEAKLDYITVTQAVDLDTMESNVTTNNAKVTYPGSADAGELNILDGATLTTTELNYVDGVTSAIQTQLNSKMDDVVDDTTPQLGGDLDYNSNGLKLVSQTVGGSNGDLVYLSASTTWSQTDADAEATTKGALGIRISATDVLTHGVYTTSGLTAGSTYYVSTTAGEITLTAPSASGDIVRIVGFALSTTELYFNPDGTYIEI